MKLIFDNEQIDKVLIENKLVVAYFSGENCNVCKSLKPKIVALIQQQFPEVFIVEVPTEKAPELLGRYRIFTIPGIMFFVEGREYIREVRNISTVEFIHKMAKIIALYNQ